MLSKIKSLSKTEHQLYLVFERDDVIVKTIEKTFQHLKHGFTLSDYKKKYGEISVDYFWELYKKDSDFSFSLVVRKTVVRLKLKASLKFTQTFFTYLKMYTTFSTLSPKSKARFERKRIKV